jgi:hypothetical protein
MNKFDPLVWYGIAVIITSGLLILIPYLRGKTDLVTGWNVLLLGLAMFTGVGCIEVKHGTFHWSHLDWFQPTAHEVNWYITSSAVFIATLFASHYFIPLGKKMAAGRMRKWPPLGASTYLFMIAMCGGILILSLFTHNITFVREVMMKFSHKAAIFGCAFAFILWYRNRSNLAWLLLFIGVFLVAALFCMVVSPGRRLLLSVFLGPIFAVYWLQARYWKPQYSLALLSLAAIAILIVSVVYSSFRWFSKGIHAQERTAGNVIQQIGRLGERENMFDLFLGNKLHYISQYNVTYAMLTKRSVDMGNLKPRLMNTLQVIAFYPIPRRIWPEKPEAIATLLARNIGERGSTTWPGGPPAHGAYEGGIPVLMLYGFLLALGVHFFDAPLRAQPTNPFLISVQAAALPHLITMPRGDFGNMSLNAFECFVFVFLFGITCRLLFGTEPSHAPGSQTTRHRLATPLRPVV